MLNSIRKDYKTISQKNTPLTTFRDISKQNSVERKGMAGTDATTAMMTPLDSAKIGNGKNYEIQTINIFLDLNDDEHTDENIPVEQDDFHNPNPSQKFNVKFVASTKHTAFSRRSLSISEKK